MSAIPIESQQLLGYDGTIVHLAEMITLALIEGAAQVPNSAHEQWMQQGQLVLSTILSSLSEDILGQVFFLAHHLG